MTRKLFKHKWLVLILFCIIIVIFDALALNVSIVNRGIVIGMALDIEGKDLMVTAQFMLPKNGGVNGGGNNYLIMSSTDKTFQGCLDKLSQQLGSTVSLSHTIVLIMGKTLFEEGQSDIIDKIMIKDIMNDTLLLCMADGKGKDILSAQIAYAEATSFQLQRLMKPIKAALGQPGITMKRYLVDYYDKNGANYLPIVHTEKGEPSSDQGKEGTTEVDILRINRSAIIGKDGFICELSDNANDGFTLLKQEVDGGVIRIVGRDGKDLGVKIIEANSSSKYNLNSKTVKYTIEAKVIRETGSPDENNLIGYKLSPEEKQSTINQITAMVTDCFNELKLNNGDALLLYENFYRRYGKAWTSIAGDGYLQDLQCEVEVIIKER